MLGSTAPPQREVAAGVANLGNTCYMNAVLQALAHAPELCLAMDYEAHHLTCPVAKENTERLRKSPPVPPSAEAKKPTRKSRRSGKKSPATTTDSEESLDFTFCTLCEVEDLIKKVHKRRASSAVAPETFVSGFINHVAPPWFKLGIQEDSHEFLRLLIDAMQKSSTRVLSPDGSSSPLPSMGESKENDKLYPFKLFRGTVESNVRCASCKAESSTIDPIEDIGLEVTQKSGCLSDLSSSFQRFTLAEPLTGYKCDRCGKVGSATKQSRLASIPPILTIHLKRFRYGSDGKPLPPPPRRGREVSQLVGSSGSAKIEGHVKFLEIFDLKPFLTESLQDKVKSMFCRLFAVIVHAGKNSHSGHYVAYVRNLSKNEWFKMDDARVSRANSQEVMNAEAYMLFYRVVDHPVAQELRAKHANAADTLRQEKEAQENKEAQEKKMKAANVEDFLPVVASLTEKPSASPTTSTPLPISNRDDSTSTKNITASSRHSTSSNKRKRDSPLYLSGEQWSLARTHLPPALTSLIRRAEEIIGEQVELTPECFKSITDEISKGGSSKGGPPDVDSEDIQNGIDRFRPAIINLLYLLATRVDGGVKCFLRKKEATASKDDNDSKENAATNNSLVVPVLDSNDTLLL
eukprot:CAMPEP_0194216046 /NCGR_PEP_ID=MMETSP0156-20130528/18231_1 /TAXON_ID=33649 /ORGANISM="Thalassionema nitzschioides, Strain L26-B" /LENGTH=632 /DNA_ID=CAMNT_0038944717 /DNA_START=144 /DNA_END=2042 /DNA_ORIENTATION=+